MWDVIVDVHGLCGKPSHFERFSQVIFEMTGPIPTLYSVQRILSLSVNIHFVRLGDIFADDTKQLSMNAIQKLTS